MPTLSFTLKIMLTVFGAMCVSIAFLLREDEEGRIQNRLENLWIKIDDLQKQAVSRHIAFIRTVSDAVSNLFNRVFGSKIFSIRSFCISTCLSIALIFLTIFSFNYFTGKRDSILYELLGTGIIILIYGIVVALITDRKWLRVWYAGFCYFIYAKYLQYTYEFISASISSSNPLPVLVLLMMILGLGGGSVVFALLIGIVRKSLVWLSKSNSLLKLILIILLNSLPMLSVYIGAHSVIYSLIFYEAADKAGFTSGAGQWWSLGIVLMSLFFLVCIIITNLIFTFSAIIFIALSIAVLLHKAFWPVLERPIYALQRFGVIQRRKTVAGLGVLLILASWGKWDIILKMLDKLILS